LFGFIVIVDVLFVALYFDIGIDIDVCMYVLLFFIFIALI